MPIETEQNPHRIATGRSWRDLPPQPPSSAPLRPAVARPESEIEETRSRPWRRVAVGVTALVVGISVGVWAPWSGDASESTEPLAADDLPETIVPDPPEELQPVPPPSDDPFAAPPGDLAPEEFFDQLPGDFLDGLPDEFLEQLPEGFFDGLPGAPAVQPGGLIEMTDLPDGYQARSNVFSEANERASQRIRLLGPQGAIDVQAIRGPDVALPTSGDAIDVAGAEGRLEITETATTLTWLAADDLLVTVEAGPGVDVDTLIDIAAAVEVLE